MTKKLSVTIRIGVKMAIAILGFGSTINNLNLLVMTFSNIKILSK